MTMATVHRPVETGGGLPRFGRRAAFLAAVLSAAAAVLIAAPIPTEASEWTPFGLQGIDVRSLAAAPNLLCAWSYANGVYCRNLTPGGPGTGWQSIGLAGASITRLWIDPLLPERRFAAAGKIFGPPSLYRTLNGGGSWTAIDNFPNPGGPTPKAWAVQGEPGGGALWAAGWTVWVSNDLGDSWSVASSYAGIDCLEIAPADRLEIWSGGETNLFMGFTIRTLNGGASWESVWDSHGIGDNQTADVAVNAAQDGLVLTGHEGFVLRTGDHGATWSQVLTAGVRFFPAWDATAPGSVTAAGSPNGGTARAFVGRDRGLTWTEITGTALVPHTVFRIESDAGRTGVVYAATETGVYRHYGGGAPVCLDSRAGFDSIRITHGSCTATPGVELGPLALGDVIAVDLAQVQPAQTFIDLGEAECLASYADLALITLDTPDPAPGRCLGILTRPTGASHYGYSSSGLPRRPSSGDCP